MTTRPRPIIAVIGTTGVGKSQFAIDLARSVSPRKSLVLSADSMQLYEGLPVITNKVTEEEMMGVEHWGLDVVKPGQGGAWEIGTWINEAQERISEMDSEDVAIICGGTHYYTQHLLFPPSHLSTDRQREGPTNSTLRWTPPCPVPPLPADFDPDMERYLKTFYLPDPVYPPAVAPTPSTSKETSNASRPTLVNPAELLTLHRLLTALDPAEAARWHWRDGRKVRRAIERWWEAGLRSSSSYGKQAEPVASETTTAEANPQYRSLIFWVYEDPTILMPRLDKRVDNMVDNGLLEEIIALRKEGSRIYGSENVIDHEEGIFQSIGYKEFANIPTDCLTPSHPLFASALERMKLSTRQYAKKQLKWVRKQLLPAVRQARLEGKEVEVYVVKGGVEGGGDGPEVMKAFLNGEQLPDFKTIGHEEAHELLSEVYAETLTPGNVVPDVNERQLLNARQDCPICSTPGEPVSIAASEWDRHISSRGHKRAQRAKSEQVDYTAVREEARRRKEEKERQLREEIGSEGGKEGEGSVEPSKAQSIAEASSIS